MAERWGINFGGESLDTFPHKAHLPNKQPMGLCTSRIGRLVGATLDSAEADAMFLEASNGRRTVEFGTYRTPDGTVLYGIYVD